MKKLCSFSLALAATMYLASTALASSIPLFTNQVTKLKFTNYEQLIDNNGNGVIDAGDQFKGILTVTTVSNVASNNVLWTNGGSDELTGSFQITVASVTNASDGSSASLPTDIAPPAGSDIYVNFDMSNTAATSSTGIADHLSMYYDSTPDFSADTSSEISVSNDIANAENGNLWLEVLGTDYIKGINETTHTTSTNYNWANLTTNDTGYGITSQLWPDTAGLAGLFGSLTTQIYFQDFITALIPSIDPVNNPSYAYDTGWTYRSEDPLYLRAVPEPATMTLFGLGLLFGGASIKRRRNSLK
jgi:hypothetical protein